MREAIKDHFDFKMPNDWHLILSRSLSDESAMIEMLFIYKYLHELDNSLPSWDRSWETPYFRDFYTFIRLQSFILYDCAMLCYCLVQHCALLLLRSPENFSDLYCLLCIPLVLSSHCCQHVMQMPLRDATVFSAQYQHWLIWCDWLVSAHQQVLPSLSTGCICSPGPAHRF